MRSSAYLRLVSLGNGAGPYVNQPSITKSTSPFLDKTMTEQPDRNAAIQRVKDEIDAAFPDVNFTGQITSVDGRLDEELDEEQGLYEFLKQRRWSEVDQAFIEGNPDGIELLTDDAFAAFLPAWLSRALVSDFVRPSVVLTFSTDIERSPYWTETMGRRMGLLTVSQKATLLSFLTHCFDIETLGLAKKDVRSAIAYVSRFDVQNSE